MEDEAIFNDTSRVIYEALKKVYSKRTSKKEMSATAFKIALEQLI